MEGCNFGKTINMKKFILLIPCILFYGFINAQTISVEDPIAIKWPEKDSLVTIDFYIPYNDTSVKYKIKITDSFRGSAIAGKDYEFSALHLSDISEKGSFTLNIKSNFKKDRRTIILKNISSQR